MLRPASTDADVRDPVSINTGFELSDALDLIRLRPLMDRTVGSRNVAIGLIDGPVAVDHPDLAEANVRVIGRRASQCSRRNPAACAHGTFIAGILHAKRTSAAAAICPGCTLIVRPIFDELAPSGRIAPSADADELAAAIIEMVDAEVRVVNLSVETSQLSSGGRRSLEQALQYAADHGVVIVCAAGNGSTLGGSLITNHPWVIPVVAYDLTGRPLALSNFGHSIGSRGLGAPGDRVQSLSVNDTSLTLSGTSAAAPFVTGAIGLLWSEFPHASGADIKTQIKRASARTWSRSVVPPLLDSWTTYEAMRVRFGTAER